MGDPGPSDSNPGWSIPFVGGLGILHACFNLTLSLIKNLTRMLMANGAGSLLDHIR